MDRNEVIKWFFSVERRYDLSLLKYKGIDLWPIIKADLFFLWYNNLENEEKSTIKHKRQRKTLNGTFRNIYLLLKKGYKKDTLYGGFSAHRTVVNDRFINKFFESMININNNSFEIEYGDKLDNYCYSNNSNILFLQDFIPFVKLLGVIFKQKNPDLNILSNILIEFKEFINLNTKDYEIKLYKKFHLIYLYSILFTWILKFTKIKTAYILCYYNIQMFGLIYALNKRRIITYDVQHGSQGKLHPMYFYDYDKIESKYFNTLPNRFWVWDTPSKNSLLSWLPLSKHKNIEINGNPWINYSINLYKKEYLDVFKGRKKIILITLQETFVDNKFINLINNFHNSEYEWWIRFHPRMKDEIDIWNNYFCELQNVNIYEATDIPLPIILSYTTLHISKYSGSIIESSLLGVLTFILDDIGVITYNEYIDNKVVFDISEMDVHEIKDLILLIS